MRKIFLFGLMISASISFSQTSPLPQLPQVLPPSPEAYSIAKGGQTTVGLFSGTAQASIPLYDLKIQGFNLPISSKL